MYLRYLYFHYVDTYFVVTAISESTILKNTKQIKQMVKSVMTAAEHRSKPPVIQPMHMKTLCTWNINCLHYFYLIKSFATKIFNIYLCWRKPIPIRKIIGNISDDRIYDYVGNTRHCRKNTNTLTILFRHIWKKKEKNTNRSRRQLDYIVHIVKLKPIFLLTFHI